MPTAATPADLTITSRKLSVDRGTATPRWWHGGDPIATAFYNALSATFPQGEMFFIEAVRRYREQTDPQLQEQIAAFVQQEALHAREHVAFNRLIKDGGYEMAAMDAYTRHRLEIARARHPIGQLAMTVALEHFTASMAHHLLRDADPMPGAPPDVVKLWQWHALEEIEHKSVAFDTYLAATKNLSALRRWTIRCQVMLLVSFLFWRSIFRHMADFLRQDRLHTPGSWLRVAKFLLVKPGLARRILLPYLSFYRPGFHPWQHDDRALIAAAERRLTAPGSLP